MSRAVTQTGGNYVWCPQLRHGTTLPHTGPDLTYLAAAGAFTAAGALIVGGVACRNRKDIR